MMGLSQACVEQCNYISKAVHEYGDWGYDTHHWSRLINAMFLCADVASNIIDEFSFEDQLLVDYKRVRGNANRIVLMYLLDKNVTDEEIDRANEVIAIVAPFNPRLVEAINTVYEWSKSPIGIAATLHDESLIIHVDKAYALIKR